jgi:hypothetical protein
MAVPYFFFFLGAAAAGFEPESLFEPLAESIASALSFAGPLGTGG